MVVNSIIYHSQVDIYILPKNERKVEWILRPLVAGFVRLPSLSLTVPAGNNFIARYICHTYTFNSYFIFILCVDEEYKVSKTRLLEVIERSLPSHIYILVSSMILLHIDTQI